MHIMSFQNLVMVVQYIIWYIQYRIQNYQCKHYDWMPPLEINPSDQNL